MDLQCRFQWEVRLCVGLEVSQSFILSVYHISSVCKRLCAGSCENGWVFYKQKCYYTSKLMLSWHDAEKNCIQQRAHLMVVNDHEELVNTNHCPLRAEVFPGCSGFSAERMCCWECGLTGRHVHSVWRPCLWKYTSALSSTTNVEHWWGNGE